jgi:hypothetical protein
MAAALVHSGRSPDTIRSLADLAAPEALKIILIFFGLVMATARRGTFSNRASSVNGSFYCRPGSRFSPRSE